VLTFFDERRSFVEVERLYQLFLSFKCKKSKSPQIRAKSN